SHLRLPSVPTRRSSDIKTATNSGFAKAGVSCFYNSEVLNSSFVHLMKFSANNPRPNAKPETVSGHPKRRHNGQETNRQMNRQANASAKSKEGHFNVDLNLIRLGSV